MQRDLDYISLYISTSGNDCWSGLIDCPNIDNTDGPIATIEKAKERIKRLKSIGKLNKPVKVFIRGGIYRIDKPIVFKVEDSAPVTYCAYPDEKPIFKGSKNISGWQEENVNGLKMYTVVIPEVVNEGWYFRQLFVNKERRSRTRLPKKGFYWIENVQGINLEEPFSEKLLVSGTNYFQYKKGDMKNWNNIEDVDIIVHHFWVDERMPAHSVDEENRIFKSSVRSTLVLKDDVHNKFSKYYVENTFDGLTEPGEWYLDRKNGKLSYIPFEGETIENIDVEAPVVFQFLRFEGEPENNEYIENIKFENIIFNFSDWYHTKPNSFKCPDMFVTRSMENVSEDCATAPQGAIHVPGSIYFKGTRNCHLKGCTIEHVGFYAVELYNGCSGNSISDCEMNDLGAGGIKQNGSSDPAKPKLHNHSNIIKNNYIHNGGNVFSCGIGILLQHTYKNQVCNNTICDLYYSGISAGWVWGFVDSISKENVIEKNLIFNLGKGIMSDMGGIYILGPQPGTVLRNNIIHDIESCNYGGLGIYLDEGSAYIIVEDNIVYKTSSEGFFLHIGRENIVRNNIFAFCQKGQLTCMKSHSPFYSEFQNNLKSSLTVQRNILISNGEPINVIGEKIEKEKNSLISEMNLYWDYCSKEKEKDNFGTISVGEFGGTEIRMITIDEWKKLGYDIGSIFIDPLFNDALNYDFSLCKDSPAFNIGFNEISTYDVGSKIIDAK